MSEIIMNIVFIVIGLAVAVRTAFYAVEVIVNARASKKTLKMCNKLLKHYEPVFDYLQKFFDNNGDI